MTQELPRIPESLPLSYDPAELPDLISVQKESYDWFCDQGLAELFESFSPIEDYTGNIALEFLDYTIGEPSRTMQECRERDATYEAPLSVKVRLINKEIPEITESEVYLGELPIMTDRGKFIINGAKRVVISQLARSPGVYFSDTIDSAGRVRFSAKVIPNDGAWLEIDTSAKGVLAVKLGQTRKFPVTALLRALQWLETDGPEDVPPTGTDEEMLHAFGEEQSAEVKGLIKQIEEREAEALPGIEAHEEYFATRTLTDRDGEIVAEAWEALELDALQKLADAGVKKLEVIRAPFELRATLEDDESSSAEQGLLEVYRKIRPGDPPTVDSAESLLHSYFFDVKRYDLSRVGRYKINRKLGVDVDIDIRTLRREDVVAMVRYLLGLPRGEGEVDDIDHLQNKRVRAIGELLQSQLRTGFMRTERVGKERMTSMDPEDMVPGNVISTKPIAAAINSFFGSGQLSQFMDEVNPLAELAHTRRVSALGPGGLSKQSAKLEVRDVHHSHYGRICPVQSPEGQLVGLTGYLALHARLNEFGFIEAPYRKVVDGYPTDEVVYMTADEEEGVYIASASAPRDEDGRLQGTTNCRYKGQFAGREPEEVDFIDYSASQVFSVSTGLIPFLDHDDAVRALAGSNMQRQAVPLIKTAAPCIRSGLEGRAAQDSGVVVLAEQDGRVIEANSERVVVEYVDGSLGEYELENFIRTNMGTCVTQRRLVREGDSIRAGQPLADGPSTSNGELAIGNDLRICFLPWEGYNFEDSILISERVVQEDRFTTIHIEELNCVARDTKLGQEEITADIPNVSESLLAKLDESGIVYVGAEVRTGDILVGKVTPKGETQLTPEEKLLRAIFGEKASDVKDTSLRVPSGIEGTVIDVRVFTRDGVEKDARARSIEESDLAGVRKDLRDQQRIYEEDIYARVERLLTGKVAAGGPEGLSDGTKVTKKYLAGVSRNHWFEVRLRDDDVNAQLEELGRQLADQAEAFEKRFQHQKAKLSAGDDLPPGVQKMVKVYVAIKRRMQPGDKMAGRHGNKGVISMIVPEEDMPFLEDGTPVDIVLNPLGVPSRMNVGQVLEVHLGWAAKGLGLKIGRMLEAQAEIARLREFLEQIYGGSERKVDIDSLTDVEILALCGNLRKGVPMATPVFDGANEDEIKALLRLADLPETGQAMLFDGRSGESFDRPVTVGFMHMLKLNHLVDDKMHARSTGPYSLVTQQPLGGKAQFGGQRFGEMEVWALEAYGAAYTLQEMLTVKADDVQGRNKMYKNIVDGEHFMEANVPESFNVLMKEIRSLGINIELEQD